MKRHLTRAALAAALGLVAVGSASAAIPNPVFSEDFNSLILGPSVNERIAFVRVLREASDPNSTPFSGVYSDSAPGWTVDNMFDAFGNVDLSYDPDTDGNGTYQPHLDGVPPVGTIIGNVGVSNLGSATSGVDEWEGWSFVDKTFWTNTDPGQGREFFSKASGTVAVVDPDEYDDFGDGRGGGYYNSGLKTPAIDVTGIDMSGGFGFVTLDFDSSRRTEAFDDDHTTNPGLLGSEINNQTVVVYATYGGSNPRTVQVTGSLFDSDAGDSDPVTFRPASPTYVGEDFDLTDPLNPVLLPTGIVDEHVQYGVQVDPGDTSVQFTFGILNAGNDWWWAIDNVDVQDGLTTTQLFADGFEGVTLEDSVNERQADSKATRVNTDTESIPRDDSFTKTAPAGWSVSTTAGVGVVGDNNIGVYEWEGWSFTDLDFWNFADKQGRENFAAADGIFAVVDGDEWDDLGNPDALGPQDSEMATPTFDISSVAPGELYLELDSSWRTEDPQFAEIYVEYDDGLGPQLVYRFDGTTYPEDTFNKTTSPSISEHLAIKLQNPVGATQAMLKFRYNGTDDWWWAIDNIKVGAVPEPTSLALCGLALVGLCGLRRQQ